MSTYDTLPAETPTPSRSRWLPVLIVLGVVVVAVVVLSAIMFFGADDEVRETASPIPIATAVAGEDDEGDDLVGTSVPVTTYEVFLSRDPFERVVPDQVQQTSTDTGGTTNGGSGTGDGSGNDAGGDTDGSGDTDGNSTTPDDQNGPACVGQQELVCDGQVVTLIDVTTVAGEAVAVIQVDTTVYEVRRGQTFASNYQVRAIDGSCVSLLYGDDGFQLCRGDTVLK